MCLIRGLWPDTTTPPDFPFLSNGKLRHALFVPQYFSPLRITHTTKVFDVIELW